MVALEKLSEEPPIHLEISALDAFYLVAQLQLVLRHPANRGPAAATMRNWTKQVQEQIAPVGSELHNLMELGWDASNDVPQKKHGGKHE